MKVDTNTKGHRQWFYFSIKSKTKRLIKLNVYRFKKCYSLFQRGMKPYVRSVKGLGDWKAGGVNVKYIREKQSTDYGVKKGSAYFYLSFQYLFQHQQDEVFFAAGIPYTYSFLKQRILHFQQQCQQLGQLKLSNVLAGKSMCGLDVRILKIQPLQSHSQSNRRKKKIIVINSRTHSGQASGSWVLDGLIDFLIKDPSNVQWMRQYNISFYILPMLNPDGVLMGNYRTGIVGDDFNRKFASGRKEIFPEILYLKKMVFNAKKQGQLLMFMDLHGHSILKNSFIYGPSETDFKRSILKKLPFYLWHKSKYFKMTSCKFLTQRQKIQTARMYFQTKENVLSFTCENSLGLYAANQQTFQLIKEDWQKFGVGIIEAIRTTIESDKGKMDLSDENQQKDKEDLQDVGSLKLREKIEILTKTKANDNLKVKLRTQKMFQMQRSIRNTQDFSNVLQSTQKISTKHQKTENKQFLNNQKSFFFSYQPTQKLISQPKSIQINPKLSQIRSRFPSFTSKQLKSKQTISTQLRIAHNQVREKVGQGNIIQRNHTQQKKRNQKIELQKNSIFVNPLQNNQSGNKSGMRETHKIKKNDKKEFLESVYHKKELKDLKIKQIKQYFSLGSKLGPVVEDMMQKIDQRKNKISPLNTVMRNDDGSIIKEKNLKKYSCDIDSQMLSSNTFDNIQVSLNRMRGQRSHTFDESYLKSQIEKMKEMEETERENSEDYRVDPWNEGVDKSDQIVFDDNFSEKFDDSVNDSDGCSEDLPQQDKRQIMEYIRSHNARKDNTFAPESDESDYEKDNQLKLRNSQQLSSSHVLNPKKRINGFREIVFKQDSGDLQEKPEQSDLMSKQLNNPKIHKNPHKFKQSLGVIKHKSFCRKIQLQKDPEQLYITHKKKLNQRSLRRQSRKEPFVLIARREKNGGGTLY